MVGGQIYHTFGCFCAIYFLHLYDFSYLFVRRSYYLKVSYFLFYTLYSFSSQCSVLKIFQPTNALSPLFHMWLN